MHLADFVMPLFLFMVGVSMAFSMKKYCGPGLKWKVIARTIKLFILGVLTQGANIWLGGDGIDIKTVRIPGILQRIAFAYFVVAMMKLCLPVWTARGFEWRGVFDADGGPARLFSHYCLHWAGALAFFFLYVYVMLFVTVPSWEWTSAPSSPAHWEETLCTTTGQAEANATRIEPAVGDQRVCTSTWVAETAPQVIKTVCGVRGDLTPKCSATRMVDQLLIGFRHMYFPVRALLSRPTPVVVCRVGRQRQASFVSR